MSGLWQDALELPESLQTTLDRAEGIGEVVRLLNDERVRRIVVTGNGAAYYVALAMSLAALRAPEQTPSIVALPAGVLGNGGVTWRSGDALLAVSSSGELRDVIRAAGSRGAKVRVAITANPESSLARAVDAFALVHTVNERAPTHTQAYCGNLLVVLRVLAEMTGDGELKAALAAIPEKCARLLASAREWASEAAASLGAPEAAVVFGTGCAWVSALETALLLKEVASVPSEGSETLEGATTAMTGLSTGHLALSIGGSDNELLEEAEAACASRGAVVLRVPGAKQADARLSPITSFPAALALAITLGQQKGLDVDAPPWFAAYLAVARDGASPDSVPTDETNLV